MSDMFESTAPGEDDFAGMLASLETRLERGTIARALGVREPELELIAIGRSPKPEAGERLRALYELAERTEGDLDDHRSLLDSESRLMVPIAFEPRLKTFIVAFLVLDAVVVALVVLLVLALR